MPTAHAGYAWCVSGRTTWGIVPPPAGDLQTPMTRVVLLHQWFPVWHALLQLLPAIFLYRDKAGIFRELMRASANRSPAPGRPGLPPLNAIQQDYPLSFPNSPRCLAW